MKKNIYFILSLCLLCTSTTILANKDGRILLTAQLSGGQEVPAVNTKAKGLVTFTLEEDRSLTVNGVFDSLSGPVTNCHFHKAIAGVGGGVVLDLKPFIKGNRIYGTIAAVTIKPLIVAMMRDSIYINVHTAANTGGEIRGQLSLQTDSHYWTLMTGFNEVPVVNVTGLGLASVVVSKNLARVDYKIVASGLTGAITSAHFHYGAADKTGPVAFTLDRIGNVLSGSIVLPDSKFIDSLNAGRVYVNIHTAANRDGEVRGQLSKVTGAIGFDALIDGAQEVPATTSKGKSLMVGWTNYGLDTMQYAVLYDSITPTNAHFHNAVAGVNGGVVTALTAYNRAPTLAYVDRIALSNDNLNKFLKEEMYVNIHTAAFTGGEIRGQVSTTLHEGMVGDLCSKQEVPANASTAIGAGFLSVDRNKQLGYYSVVTNGLTGNAISAHIHKGAKGANGGVFQGFSVAAGNNAFSNVFTFATTTAADSAINGLMYFNVHTAANTGGEIRGQIGKALTLECLPTSIFELNGQTFEAKVYPNPANEMVTVEFGSNQAMDAQIVVSDLMGRNVIQKNIQMIDGENQIGLNLGSLTNGLYFLRIQKEGKMIFTEKILKN
jgi:CHRD domain/Secretion system C-terminal sorting domain